MSPPAGYFSVLRVLMLVSVLGGVFPSLQLNNFVGGVSVEWREIDLRHCCRTYNVCPCSLQS